MFRGVPGSRKGFSGQVQALLGPEQARARRRLPGPLQAPRRSSTRRSSRTSCRRRSASRAGVPLQHLQERTSSRSFAQIGSFGFSTNATDSAPFVSSGPFSRAIAIIPGLGRERGHDVLRLPPEPVAAATPWIVNCGVAKSISVSTPEARSFTIWEATSGSVYSWLSVATIVGPLPATSARAPSSCPCRLRRLEQDGHLRVRARLARGPASSAALADAALQEPIVHGYSRAGGRLGAVADEELRHLALRSGSLDREVVVGPDGVEDREPLSCSTSWRVSCTVSRGSGSPSSEIAVVDLAPVDAALSRRRSRKSPFATRLHGAERRRLAGEGHLATEHDRRRRERPGRHRSPRAGRRGEQVATAPARAPRLTARSAWPAWGERAGSGRPSPSLRPRSRGRRSGRPASEAPTVTRSRVPFGT